MLPKPATSKRSALPDTLLKRSQTIVLQHFLQTNGVQTDINTLLRDAVLVTIHRKWLEHPPHTPTEIGIATFDRKQVNDGQPVFPGPHAEDLLKHVWFMHLRLRRGAHLPAGPGDPDAFHFGTSVFVSHEEALDMLHEIWHQPIDEKNPGLGFRPIICLSFGDNHSLSKTRKDFDFDPANISTTAAMLDAQVIATQARITSSQYPSIEYLLHQFRILPHDHGNSGNAAAYITMVAFLSALRKEVYESLQNPRAKPGQSGPSSSKPAQHVINWLMQRPTPAPPFGTTTYCYRCSNWAHVFVQCQEKDFVCSKCLRSDSTWRRANAATHKEGLCIFHF
ncbi:hypothetical protein BU26DRAFT_604555 [Trematosphaeria pertusa]|uniref:Gfd2/YDR514C-like C-terminal domain-containing protein n=1 Tax=Trematosphaeria pertusa TaxID=390896 RepID=A0A6A6IJJ1_9PLEO|nr:uncharacterized protein BU26DRAFT_604555 [Trematosphaeria pertusa]KAF2250389.1 hypothetical protein BU26DRAFT_604555 [Trematosphaeria pertusa]